MSDVTPQASMRIIDQFLQANLLSMLGSDEQRYKHVAQAAADVAAHLAKVPADLITFAQVAFQSAPDSSEPAIALVHNALKAHWKLIDNVYAQERPVTLLRAVMLEAVGRLCASDNRLAAIVYHTNASAFAYRRYGHAEAAVISRILADAGEAAEAFAVEGFSGGSGEDVSITEVKIPVPSAKSVAVDTAVLQDGLVAAVGPHDRAGNTPKTTPVNPYWPDSGSHWSHAYPPIAAPAISNAISGSVQSGLAALANTTSKAVNASLNAVVENARRAARSMPRNLSVLWWMQALYSPTLRRSYRDLDVVVAAVAMAHDLMHLDVAPCPESLVYILGEAVRDAIEDHEQQHRAPATLANWLQLLGASNDGEVLRSTVRESPALTSHTAPLLAVVRTVLHGHKPPRAMLGELFEAEVTPRQLAMWLFRDLIAERLARST